MDADFLLIQRMKIGDDSAVDMFVHKYYPKILQYCRFHISDLAYAEDLTQETFERFFRTFERYQDYGKVMNYLYVIAANACKDYYKRAKEYLFEELPVGLVTNMDKLEDRIDVETALNCLPLELKEVTILFFFQEIKQKEIAKILGIGLPLVKYRIKKSKELLATYLGKEV